MSNFIIFFLGAIIGGAIVRIGMGKLIPFLKEHLPEKLEEQIALVAQENMILKKTLKTLKECPKCGIKLEVAHLSTDDQEIIGVKDNG